VGFCNSLSPIIRLFYQNVVINGNILQTFNEFNLVFNKSFRFIS
jgi:hypothetical protein